MISNPTGYLDSSQVKRRQACIRNPQSSLFENPEDEKACKSQFAKACCLGVVELWKSIRKVGKVS